MDPIVLLPPPHRRQGKGPQEYIEETGSLRTVTWGTSISALAEGRCLSSLFGKHLSRLGLVWLLGSGSPHLRHHCNPWPIFLQWAGPGGAKGGRGPDAVMLRGETLACPGSCCPGLRTAAGPGRDSSHCRVHLWSRAPQPHVMVEGGHRLGCPSPAPWAFLVLLGWDLVERMDEEDLSPGAQHQVGSGGKHAPPHLLAWWLS